MRAPPTPSSLKWLINRRARLDGEIHKFEQQEVLRKAQAQSKIESIRQQLDSAVQAEELQLNFHRIAIQSLQRDLDATDLLLRQHEVPIDPSIIKRVRSHDNLSIADHGFYTSCIYECLRLNPDRPCTATIVASFIAAKSDAPFEGPVFSELRYRIRQRMKYLAWQGKITRVPNQVGSLEGRWRLNLEQEISIPLEIRPDGAHPASSPATIANAPS